MVALGISTIVLAGLMAFNIQLIKGGLFSEHKNRINRDIRKVTTDLGQVAKESNYFIIYPSFATDDRNDSDDRLVSNESGDFILFVYTAPYYVSYGTQPVERIVGFFRSSGKVDDLNNVGPIMRFDVTLTSPVDITTSSGTTLESLIPAADSVNATQVLELSKGTANGKLFYNFGNKSAMINGQIYHGNHANRATDTYNFTVSPRG